MPIMKRVRGMLTEPSANVLYECRDCGTNFDGREEHCHCCGGSGIARYEF